MQHDYLAKLSTWSFLLRGGWKCPPPYLQGLNIFSRKLFVTYSLNKLNFSLFFDALSLKKRKIERYCQAPSLEQQLSSKWFSYWLSSPWEMNKVLNSIYYIFFVLFWFGKIFAKLSLLIQIQSGKFYNFCGTKRSKSIMYVHKIHWIYN